METTHVSVNNQKLIQISYTAPDFTILDRESNLHEFTYANVNRGLGQITRATILISEKSEP